jgi:hypothetical protein
MESQEASSSPQAPSGRTGRRVGVFLAGVAFLGVAGGILHWTGFGSYFAQRREYAARTATFSGGSEALRRTTIAPTLDSPCPAGQNIIWCSSFQLAWNEVRDGVIGAPLEVPGAEEIAARLNTAKQSVADLDAGSVYAAGGWIKKGIRERIQRDMAAKFPSHVLADFGHHTDGILAYSYLTANVSFKYPFRQVEKGLTFTDSQGIQTQVAGFGLWEAYLRPYKNVREQVEILCVRPKDWDHPWELAEYVIDLCRHSRPYQVVVARADWKGSLAETLEHIRTLTADFQKSPPYEKARWLGENDELTIPEMSWRIDHRFNELIGRGVANVGMPIVEALQTIELRLDRSGTRLESEATFAIAALPRHFEFNRPFLIYLQKRDAEHPFFAMWVDNAELLVAE